MIDNLSWSYTLYEKKFSSWSGRLYEINIKIKNILDYLDYKEGVAFEKVAYRIFDGDVVRVSRVC